jgi:hypothetical protein
MINKTNPSGTTGQPHASDGNNHDRDEPRANCLAARAGYHPADPDNREDGSNNADPNYQRPHAKHHAPVDDPARDPSDASRLRTRVDTVPSQADLARA